MGGSLHVDDQVASLLISFEPKGEGELTMTIGNTYEIYIFPFQFSGWER